MKVANFSSGGCCSHGPITANKGRDKFVFHPETGERMLKTKMNVKIIADWIEANPGKEPAPPSDTCTRCKELKPIADFDTFYGTSGRCPDCRRAVWDGALRRARVEQERARTQALRIVNRPGADCSFAPVRGRGNEAFERAANVCFEHSGMAEGGVSGAVEEFGVCRTCNDPITDVYEPVPADDEPHYHPGGQCIHCVWDFLDCHENTEEDFHLECPLCHAEGRPDCRLKFPYFRHSEHLTLMAHMAGIYGNELGHDSDADYEPTDDEDELAGRRTTEDVVQETPETPARDDAPVDSPATEPSAAEDEDEDEEEVEIVAVEPSPKRLRGDV
eukprot:jgi/Mesvir1/18629/Mv17138-RA.1